MFEIKQRPVGVNLFAIIHFFSSLGYLVSVFLIIVNYEKTTSAFEALGIPPWIAIFGIILLSIISMLSSIGMWTGARWGWWMVIFEYYYGIARHLNSIYMLSVISQQEDVSFSDVNSQYYKFCFRIFLYFIISLYFFRSNVVEYFKLENINRFFAAFAVAIFVALFFGFMSFIIYLSS